MECGTCFVSGCVPSPERTSRIYVFWLHAKKALATDGPRTKSSFSQSEFFRDTQYEFGKKITFQFLWRETIFGEIVSYFVRCL